MNNFDDIEMIGSDDEYDQLNILNEIEMFDREDQYQEDVEMDNSNEMRELETYRMSIKEYIQNVDGIEAGIRNDSAILSHLIDSNTQLTLNALFGDFTAKARYFKTKGEMIYGNDVSTLRALMPLYEEELRALFTIQSEILAILVSVVNKGNEPEDVEMVQFGFPGLKSGLSAGLSAGISGALTGLSGALMNSLMGAQKPRYENPNVKKLEEKISVLERHIESIPENAVAITAMNALEKTRNELALEMKREKMQNAWNKYNKKTIVNNLNSILDYVNDKDLFMEKTPVPPPCEPKNITYADINRYNYLICLENWIKNAGLMRATGFLPEAVLSAREKFISLITNKTTVFYNALYMFDHVSMKVADKQALKQYMILCFKISTGYLRQTINLDGEDKDRTRLLEIMAGTNFVIKFPTAYDFLNYYGANEQAYKLLEERFINVSYNNINGSEIALWCMKLSTPQIIEFSIGDLPLKLNLGENGYNNQLDLVIDTECENKLNIGTREVDTSIANMIGEGGFGKVFKVEIDGVQYVKKIVEFPRMSDFYAIINEIAVTRSLNHPNIIKIKSIQMRSLQENMEIYLEYVGDDVMKQLAVLTYQQKVKIIQGILKGLKYLSENGIVHNDLKLSNVVLDIQNDYNPKLIDFGLISVVEDGPLIKYKSYGTKKFIAPERDVGVHNDYRSDIYSVGVMMNQLFMIGIRNYSTSDILGVYGADLYEKMIEYEMNRRITIDEALAHPFFNVI
jgi:hypothetical protein